MQRLLDMMHFKVSQGMSALDYIPSEVVEQCTPQQLNNARPASNPTVQLPPPVPPRHCTQDPVERHRPAHERNGLAASCVGAPKSQDTAARHSPWNQRRAGVDQAPA
jgi:hypothetical protein